MQKQTDRKIRVFQIDNVGEYKDQFLQFGQNNEIGIHFKAGKHGVGKETNRSFLEKVQ